MSGRSQIAFFINLRTDLNDHGWCTGSMWSLPPDLFHAGCSVTHFKASWNNLQTKHILFYLGSQEQYIQRIFIIFVIAIFLKDIPKVQNT
jgi:hypothetical protein